MPHNLTPLFVVARIRGRPSYNTMGLSLRSQHVCVLIVLEFAIATASATVGSRTAHRAPALNFANPELKRGRALIVMNPLQERGGAALPDCPAAYPRYRIASRFVHRRCDCEAACSSTRTSVRVCSCSSGSVYPCGISFAPSAACATGNRGANSLTHRSG